MTCREQFLCTWIFYALLQSDKLTSELLHATPLHQVRRQEDFSDRRCAPLRSARPLMTYPKYAEAGSASLPPDYVIPDDAALGGQEEFSAHDHDTHENSRKRNVPTELIGNRGDENEDEPTKRRRLSSGKKSNPPPKKLNNEQWDQMFQRLVEYKAKHGVRFDTKDDILIVLVMSLLTQRALLSTHRTVLYRSGIPKTPSLAPGSRLRESSGRSFLVPTRNKVRSSHPTNVSMTNASGAWNPLALHGPQRTFVSPNQQALPLRLPPRHESLRAVPIQLLEQRLVSARTMPHGTKCTIGSWSTRQSMVYVLTEHEIVYSLLTLTSSSIRLNRIALCPKNSKKTPSWQAGSRRNAT